MAKTHSTQIPIGTKAPDFTLPNTVSGKNIKLNDVKSDIATVIMFICNHCPFVKHILPTLATLSSEYRQKGVSFIGISSNDVVNYPEDSPENMKKLANEYNFIFPYFYDETQEIAIKYNAACTPDFYIYDKDMKLIYHGQFDPSSPGNNIPVTGISLSEALDAIIDGKQLDKEQLPSLGCGIKWK